MNSNRGGVSIGVIGEYNSKVVLVGLTKTIVIGSHMYDATDNNLKCIPLNIVPI